MCRTLFDAKPTFKTFLQGVLSGKVAPVKLPQPKAAAVFTPSAEDDNPIVPSKRVKADAAHAGRKRQKNK
jgi:hypothetical protein